jgi:hypothetical protein
MYNVQDGEAPRKPIPSPRSKDVVAGRNISITKINHHCQRETEES